MPPQAPALPPYVVCLEYDCDRAVCLEVFELQTLLEAAKRQALDAESRPFATPPGPGLAGDQVHYKHLDLRTILLRAYSSGMLVVTEYGYGSQVCLTRGWCRAVRRQSLTKAA